MKSEFLLPIILYFKRYGLRYGPRGVGILLYSKGDQNSARPAQTRLYVQTKCISVNNLPI